MKLGAMGTYTQRVLTHTDEAASSESSEATVEPGQEASDRLVRSERYRD